MAFGFDNGGATLASAPFNAGSSVENGADLHEIHTEVWHTTAQEVASMITDSSRSETWVSTN